MALFIIIETMFCIDGIPAVSSTTILPLAESVIGMHLILRKQKTSFTVNLFNDTTILFETFIFGVEKIQIKDGVTLTNKIVSIFNKAYIQYLSKRGRRAL